MVWRNLVSKVRVDVICGRAALYVGFPGSLRGRGRVLWSLIGHLPLNELPFFHLDPCFSIRIQRSVIPIFSEGTVLTDAHT